MSPDAPNSGTERDSTRPWNSSGWTEKPWSATHLAPLFSELTSAQTAATWARRAVKFIHRYTRERGESPTFREVFTDLATQDPEYGDHAEAWSSRAVRSLAMLHWRRQGWVNYRPEPRTLRSGPAASELFPPNRPTRREALREAPRER